MCVNAKNVIFSCYTLLNFKIRILFGKVFVINVVYIVYCTVERNGINSVVASIIIFHCVMRIKCLNRQMKLLRKSNHTNTNIYRYCTKEHPFFYVTHIHFARYIPSWTTKDRDILLCTLMYIIYTKDLQTSEDKVSMLSLTFLCVETDLVAYSQQC